MMASDRFWFLSMSSTLGLPASARARAPVGHRAGHRGAVHHGIAARVGRDDAHTGPRQVDAAANVAETSHEVLFIGAERLDCPRRSKSAPRHADRLLTEYREALFDSRRTPTSNILHAHESQPFEAYRQLLGAMRRYQDSMTILGGCRLRLRHWAASC